MSATENVHLERSLHNSMLVYVCDMVKGSVILCVGCISHCRADYLRREESFIATNQRPFETPGSFHTSTASTLTT